MNKQELDQHWEQLKVAARLYCAHNDLDPKEMIQYPDPDGFAVVRKTTRQALIAGEFNEILSKVKCLREAGFPV